MCVPNSIPMDSLMSSLSGFLCFRASSNTSSTHALTGLMQWWDSRVARTSQPRPLLDMPSSLSIVAIFLGQQRYHSYAITFSHKIYSLANVFKKTLSTHEGIYCLSCIFSFHYQPQSLIILSTSSIPSSKPHSTFNTLTIGTYNSTSYKTILWLIGKLNECYSSHHALSYALHQYIYLAWYLQKITFLLIYRSCDYRVSVK